MSSEGCKWVSMSGTDSIPAGAVVGGKDNGEDMYIIRANHESELIPGKFVPSQGCAYIAYGCGEHSKTSFEILTVEGNQAVTWVQPVPIESVPSIAIKGGHTGDGETLYIGRCRWSGSVTIGKIHPSQTKLYISFGGSEIGVREYECLVDGNIWAPGTYNAIAAEITL